MQSLHTWQYLSIHCNILKVRCNGRTANSIKLDIYFEFALTDHKVQSKDHFTGSHIDLPYACAQHFRKLLIDQFRSRERAITIEFQSR